MFKRINGWCIVLLLFVVVACSTPVTVPPQPTVNSSSSATAIAHDTPSPTAMLLPSPVSSSTLPSTPSVPPTLSVTRVPTVTSTSNGLSARFLNIPDSRQLSGKLDQNGVPIITLSVELTGTLAAGETMPTALRLMVNGYLPMTVMIEQKTLPVRVDFRWWPRPGAYTLYIQALRANQPAKIVSSGLDVRVVDMPAPAVTQRILDLYKERFNLTLTNVPIARRDSADPAQSHWNSAVYIGDKMYSLEVYDQNKVNAQTFTFHGEPRESLCWPTGRYRVLVLFVDYGNAGIKREDAESALRTAIQENNQTIADYSKSHGAPTPILQFEATSAFIARPPVPGQLIAFDQIKGLTGYDPIRIKLRFKK